ncbi:unnamed protein product [Protopolystoma xenopodis]|uniref:Uncharacterized protein n=1 Tax=Protopolystoma xenopodis TaxID=117903 RepID=A0A448XFG7_9PLAT|nr:unnamed protein product [Protopolystoma xenopodis]
MYAAHVSYVHSTDRLDYIANSSTEKGAGDSPEVLRCRDAITVHTAAYADLALAPYFGSLINFVREWETSGCAAGSMNQPQGVCSGDSGNSSIRSVDEREAVVAVKAEEGEPCIWKY